MRTGCARPHREHCRAAFLRCAAFLPYANFPAPVPPRLDRKADPGRFERDAGQRLFWLAAQQNADAAIERAAALAGCSIHDKARAFK